MASHHYQIALCFREPA